jgi:ribosomal protein L37AE/L43A
MEICPSCGKAELVELIPGVSSCPACKKMFRGQLPEAKTEEKDTDELHDGQYFMDHTTLNKKWEICDMGITVAREPGKRWLATLMCHTPSFPNIKYLRISWWKKSTNAHAGMFKIDEYNEIENVIIALERLDALFDENFNLKDEESIHFNPIPERMDAATDSQIFDMKKRICPKCKSKMKKSRNKRYYECERCGEIIIIHESQPIFDIPSDTLPLNISTNFPVNYYLPSYGITVKRGMADLQALVIIYSMDNVDKKWLRLCWWHRNFHEYMRDQYSMGTSQGLRWETRKGSMSPNIYEKQEIRPLINSLRALRKEWAKLKGYEWEAITYEEGKSSPMKKKVSIPKKSRSSQSQKKQAKTPLKTSQTHPTLRNIKADLIAWVMTNDPANRYTKKELIKKTKAEIYGILLKLT